MGKNKKKDEVKKEVVKTPRKKVTYQHQNPEEIRKQKNPVRGTFGNKRALTFAIILAFKAKNKKLPSEAELAAVVAKAGITHTCKDAKATLKNEDREARSYARWHLKRMGEEVQTKAKEKIEKVMDFAKTLV